MGWVTVSFSPQLIRGGFDSVINLIFRLFFSKRRPAVTLEDPNIKYALRLIDKQVTTLEYPPTCLWASLCPNAAGVLCFAFHHAVVRLWCVSADCQSRHEEVSLRTAVTRARPRPSHRSVLIVLYSITINIVFFHAPIDRLSIGMSRYGRGWLVSRLHSPIPSANNNPLCFTSFALDDILNYVLCLGCHSLFVWFIGGLRCALWTEACCLVETRL